MTLLQAVVIASFGQHSDNAKRKSIVSLLTLSICAIFISIVAFVRVDSTYWPTLQNTYYPLVIGVISMQIITLICLISTYGILTNTLDSFTRLLMTLPLSQSKVWTLIHTPQIIVTLLVQIVCLPAVILLCGKLGTSLWLTIIATFLGSASAFGILYGWRLSAITRCLVAVAHVSAEVLLIRWLSNPLTPTSTMRTTSFVFSILVLVSVYSLRHVSNGVPAPLRHHLPTLPTTYWWLAKTLRSPIGGKSLAFCILLSASVAYFAFIAKLRDISMLSTGAALLAAACASDMRSLAAIRAPAEITALKGTWSFIRTQLLSCSLAVAATMPILCLVASIRGLTDIYVFVSILQVVTGCTIGYAAAVIVGSQSRDISSQCTAVLASSVVLLAMQHLSQGATHRPIVLLATYCVAIMLMYVVAYTTEFKRNRFTWRKQYAPH